jgi:hypothetical protein
MNVFVHDNNGTQIAEMQSEGIVVRSARDAADIARDMLNRGINKLILHERHMSPEFWQSSNGLAEVVLQEFASKSIAVAFVGKLGHQNTDSLNALIHDNGLQNQTFLFATVELAKIQFSTR